MLHLLDFNTAASIAAKSLDSCSIVARVTSNDTAPAAPDGCFVFRLKSTLWGRFRTDDTLREQRDDGMSQISKVEIEERTGSMLAASCLAAVCHKNQGLQREVQCGMCI